MNLEVQPLIQMQGVRKVFYTDEVETHALAEIDLTIMPGEYVCVSGPSGSGKSTLLSIMALLDTLTEGVYLLSGRPVWNLSLSQKARIRNREIGFVFQNINLIHDLRVDENVALPLTYRGTGTAERKRRVQQQLERVGMDHRIRHFPSQLSGGEQQRVAVARALVGQPSIVLADEPTGNLDSENGEIVMQLLQELSEDGITICLVTHDPGYAERAGRQIQLFDGEIVPPERGSSETGLCS